MRARVPALTAWLALLPAVVSAQQTSGVIAGLVRDSTGGVLPGVTVEVASPALIERTRTAVTGDDGQYRIVELRPGMYTVTFTLQGFGKLVRDNVQLTSGFTAAVNADLQVGDLAETITVSGASPVVDLQNVTQQTVLSAERVLAVIPTGRNYTAVGKLVPGIDGSGNSGGHDVGGSTGRDATKLIYHGSATNDFKLMIDGFPQMTWIADGSVGPQPAETLAEEVNLQYSALPAEVETGGVLFNMVPKTGGNTFRSSFFGNLATSALQFENVTPEMVAQGLTTGGDIDYVVDINPSIGGPIQRDRLWFFTTYRDFRPYMYSTMFHDVDPSDFRYTPDTSAQHPAYDAKPQKTLNSRITWQATRRNRFSLGLELSKVVQYNFFVGGKGGTTLNAPEATADVSIQYNPVVQVGWTAPINNRLLLDIGGQILRGRWWGDSQKDISTGPGAIELATNINFRSAPGLASTGYANIPFWHDFLRAAVSYTTGSHAIKIGGNLWYGGIRNEGDSQGFGPYTLRLLNGAPSGVTYRVDPLSVETRFLKGDIFAQDQWTINRLTINYGVRIDTLDSGYPAQHERATAYFPERDFESGTVMRWRDWSPRLGVAYDLFGNGKTAVKASLSRYVNWDATGLANSVNPAQTSGGNLQRTWNDSLVCAGCVPGDFVPQGDPTNPAANGEIGPSPNARWGTPVLPTRYDPEWSLGGWGIRGYNWERSVSVQQELRTNVSLNVGYFYRKFGNFSVTDNLAVGSGDYDTFCINAPRDSRLPDGGGQRICGLYDLKPGAVGRVDNFRTLASHYGDIYQDYKGFDVSMNVRLPKALLQGGLSSGRELYDFCDVVDELPETLVAGSTKVPAGECSQKQPFLTQLKLLGSYELPWALSVSATYQNAYNTTSVAPNLLPGQPRMGIGASYVATNAVVAPELGRNLSAGANANASINLVTPGTMWGDRLQQLDLRFARTFRVGRGSFKAMFDLYNALNASTLVAYNNTYGTSGAAWLAPVAIIPARLLKFGIQIDY
jgi:hypothetical protein